MLDMKRERMSVFICNAREEIVELWNDLILGEDERAEFVAFLDGEQPRSRCRHCADDFL